MDGRLGNVVETLLASGIAVAIAALLALLVRLVFKRQIGSSNYYVAALILGAVLYRGLLAALTHPTQVADTRSPSESRETATTLSLDSPFAAPPEAQLEAFPAQLDSAIARLEPNDRAAVLEAVQFLQYSTVANLAKNNPDEFAKLSESDLVAKHLVKLYRFTQQQGSSMTLRKYIELANVFKTEQPQWWEQFKAATK